MEKLFTLFQAASEQSWKDRLEKDLKGVTFERLARTDRNGITIDPFYTKESVTEQYQPVRVHPGWIICSSIPVKDAKTANSRALSELSAGAAGLLFILEENVEPAHLLAGIELPYIYLHFRLHARSHSFKDKLTEYLASQQLNLSDLQCTLSFDPIGLYLVQGEWQQDKQADLNLWKALLGGYSFLSADSSLFQNAGCTAVYELGCALAHINEYLTLYDADEIAIVQQIEVVLATDTYFFEQIAKLRAFRKLLNLLCSAYGITPSIHLRVVSSNIYRAPFDSYSNLLRDALSGMAGVLGGCDSLSILPFDNTTQTGSSNLGNRMSRNQQLIFKEESYLDKVADIAAGAYYIENRTEQIAEKAWVIFQEIEKNGGLIRYFEEGKLKKSIEEQAGQLIEAYRTGEKTLIGINKFPNPSDKPQTGTRQNATGKGIAAINLGEILLQ